MSRSSTSTDGSRSPISPGRVQFDTLNQPQPLQERKTLLQFHIISATLSEKASGKRPASVFVELSVGGKNYSTSSVSSKTSDPTWHDNLQPVWLEDDTRATFKIKHKGLVKTQLLATTKAYTAAELIAMQKDLFDRKCTINLPLEFTSSPPSSPRAPKAPSPAFGASPMNDRHLTINIRLPSSRNLAAQEVKNARARSNSVLEQRRLEQQQQLAAAAAVTTSDIDSGEDLRLTIDTKAALEIGEGSQQQVIDIIPRITLN